MNVVNLQFRKRQLKKRYMPKEENKKRIKIKIVKEAIGLNFT